MSSSSDFTPRQLRDRLLPPAGPHFVLDEKLPVLVDFQSVETETRSEADQAQASAQALNSALNSMRNVAKMVSDSMAGLVNEPSQVDVQFGLRLDASGKAYVVESENSASLKVTLTWTPPAANTGMETSQSPNWNAAPAEREMAWEEDNYDAEDWDDEDDRYWIESDDRPNEGYPAYERDDGRGLHVDDDDYDYPPQSTWSRRSPRSPWNRRRSGYDDSGW